MNDQEINIAIAEACGWEWRVGIYGNCRGLFHQDDGYLRSYKVEQMNDLPISSDCADRVPDYCNDLNAMHEAVAYLTPEQVNNFAVKLAQIVLENYCGGDVWWDLNANEVGHVANATARQRAEAFLRTIGKWKEGAK